MNEQTQSARSVEKLLVRARSLASRSVRDREQCFWIEGIRHFIQAHDAKMQFEAILESPILNRSPLAQMLARRLAATGVPRAKECPEAFRTVCRDARASGIGAIVRQRFVPLEQARDRGLCWLVVSQIRSPGNLGTILRTAEAVGASGVCFIGPQSDPFDPAVVRGSMGGLFHLPLVKTTIAEVQQWAQKQGIQLIGLSPQATKLWTETTVELHQRKKPQIALVLGEERAGLSEELAQVCHFCVRLPMCGRADSLNVAVAAGVMLYELVRHRI